MAGLPLLGSAFAGHMGLNSPGAIPNMEPTCHQPPYLLLPKFHAQQVAGHCTLGGMLDGNTAASAPFHSVATEAEC